MLHAVANGLRDSCSVKGEESKWSKLTTEEVIKIRRMYKTGAYSQYKLAALFGVTNHAIHRIVTRKCWKHVA